MKDNALYFPYISVPERSWTVKTLLYWDRVCSIVPSQYVDEPQELTAYMRELVEAGLVEQVFPAGYVYEIRDFDSRFMKILERRQRSREEWMPGPTTRIHMEKLGCVSEHLRALGVARRERGWVRLPTEIANLFMAYLAACLGQLPSIRATPVTDRLGFGRLTSGIGLRVPTADIHLLKARELILRELLPVPGQHVSLDKLIRFKQDHGQLLRRFRRHIEESAARIGREPSAEVRLELTEDFIRACEERLQEITDAMRPTWTQINLGSLVPLAGAGLTWYSTPAENTAGYVGAGLSFAGAAYLALLGARPKTPGAPEPLAYVAFAKKAFN
jgi:hypothetical protein